MRKIVVRKAVLKDKEQMRVLWKEFMKEHDTIIVKRGCRGNEAILKQQKKRKDAEKEFAPYLKKNMRSQKSIVVVAEYEGKLIGYAIAYVKENIPVFDIKELGHVSDLYVERGFRGKGISSRFKNIIFSFFRKKNIRNASIMVSPYNPKACTIYRKWGFLDYQIELRKRI